jgi:hypothetical protein
MDIYRLSFAKPVNAININAYLSDIALKWREL